MVSMKTPFQRGTTSKTGGAAGTAGTQVLNRREGRNDNEELIEKIKRLIHEREAAGCTCPPILIVDDNDFNIYSLQKQLDPFGIKAEFALNYDMTFERISHHRGEGCLGFELIFMDCDLPGKDGFETTRDLCHEMERGYFTRCPIIATTGYVDNDIKERCRLSGMSDFMSKPIIPSELAAILARWLR
eukprot:TRINITY_DN10260_c0_g1_i1.p1 TRINITY_DN10260_c0_g1~~TRINITY_DN10260_c0_g1_i1.p1  ORF type:complete len:187 (-),score=27.13 TRINITY_DN10260_c0_g1_i1:55-615(-)